jgi:UDP-N-acetylmuramoyl-tripeptide--D-alanyl-D-alanine ligase
MLAAYTVGQHFKVDTQMIVQALSSFTTRANRSEVITISGCTVIKDAYNANPSSMELALNAFAERYNGGIAILGDMKELGKESEQAHQHIIQVANELKLGHVILIGKEFKNALSKMYQQTTRTILIADSIEELKENWQWDDYSGKAILLKGSRSMHLEKLLET